MDRMVPRFSKEELSRSQGTIPPPVRRPVQPLSLIDPSTEVLIVKSFNSFFGVMAEQFIDKMLIFSRIVKVLDEVCDAIKVRTKTEMFFPAKRTNMIDMFY